ncbi:MAG: type II secretion system protein [Micrococcales bacterium]
MNALLKKLRKGADKGFTLIELLIVVSIMGVLAAIVVFSVNNARQTAVNKSCQSSAVTVAQALDQYKANAQSVSYPTTSATVAASTLVTALVPSYLKSPIPAIWTGAAATLPTPTTADYYLKVDTSGTNVVVTGYTDWSSTANPISGCNG